MSLLGRLLELLLRQPAPQPPADDVPAPVPASRRVTVRILDDRTGEPVLGAHVRLDADFGEPLDALADEAGSVAFDVPSSVTGGAWVYVEHPGYVQLQRRYDGVVDGTPLPLTDAALDPPELRLKPAVVRPAGTVALQGRTFVDGDGQYLAVGVTLFWAVWAAKNDPFRLRENLRVLRGRADFVRVLACVGGSSWDDRAVAPDDVFLGYVGTAVDMAFEQGVRTGVTIFGGHPLTGRSAATRERVVRSVCEQLVSRRYAVHHVEVSNEENDFRDDGGRAEMIRLARIVRDMLPGVPVALTSPLGGDFAGYYEDTPATLATCHLERNVTGTGGMWRPVRQAREAEPLGVPWLNNEPIGIASSVAADDDPTRLAFAAVMTWVCRGAGYVLHSGAGIRGGGRADMERGRAANLWEQPAFDPALDRILALRAVLPSDLPNWSWQNGNSRFPLFPFECPYDDHGTRLVAPEDELLRAFASLSPNGHFVCAAIGVSRDVRFTAKRAMAFDHVGPDGALVGRVELRAGQTYVLRATLGPAAIFVGSFL